MPALHTRHTRPQERLFQPKDANWLSWEAAQEARVACIGKYHAAKGETKQALLRDCLVLAFHTLQPPDRARLSHACPALSPHASHRERARLHAPCRRGRSAPHAPRRGRLAVQEARRGGVHGGPVQAPPQGAPLQPAAAPKPERASERPPPPPARAPFLQTSRFYGPTIHTLPPGIGQWVAAYEASVQLELLPPNPYLFPLATDWERGHSSSGWTQLVKSVFKRHASVATPPKLLRASFCTHLRSAEGVDTELLESCAKAMKHQVATGGSGQRTRLVPLPLSCSHRAWSVQTTTISRPTTVSSQR